MFVLSNQHYNLKPLSCHSLNQSKKVKDLYGPNAFMHKGECYNQDNLRRIRNFFPIAHKDVPGCLVDPQGLPGHNPPRIYLGWQIPRHSKGTDRGYGAADNFYTTFTLERDNVVVNLGYAFEPIIMFVYPSARCGIARHIGSIATVKQVISICRAPWKGTVPLAAWDTPMRASWDTSSAECWVNRPLFSGGDG
ncbi:hypothetical protein BD779DRAFT_1793253 [Infundibulicybe gibba]|nr:hypothetical protein BD779DRAFT_1793253 [Infundibulicybe gibba]